MAAQNPIACGVCYSMCSNPFDRVAISYLIRGGTLIYFTLVPTFTDPMPYTFQLQVGQSANQDANDWEDVGGPIINTFSAVDGEKRLGGKLRYLYYRVVLTTSVGVYVSEPTGIEGTLKQRDWRIARDLMRQERVRMKAFAGQHGYLLKRRISGEPCPVCLDYQTQEIKNPACAYCFGTGFKCGYFFPMDCVWADVDPKAYHVHTMSTRGTVADIVVKARMLNTWMLSEEDVWVNKITDDRYYVHAVQNLAEIRGVPLMAAVELRPAPFSDPIYNIDIPQQLEELERLRLSV